MAQPRRIISYSLFGQNEMYNHGMVVNARLAPQYYPGWTVRVYATPDATAVDALRELGCEVVVVEPAPGAKLMATRFLAAVDAEIAIFRDADSRLNPREAAAVADWLEQGTRFHIMHDHPYHRPSLICGGMWGVRGQLPEMARWIDQWPNWRDRDDDQALINHHVWPLARHDMTHHTSIRQRMKGQPFPPHALSPGFVGQQYDSHDNPVTPPSRASLWRQALTHRLTACRNRLAAGLGGKEA